MKIKADKKEAVELIAHEKDFERHYLEWAYIHILERDWHSGIYPEIRNECLLEDIPRDLGKF